MGLTWCPRARACRVGAAVTIARTGAWSVADQRFCKLTSPRDTPGISESSQACLVNLSCIPDKAVDP